MVLVAAVWTTQEVTPQVLSTGSQMKPLPRQSVSFSQASPNLV